MSKDKFIIDEDTRNKYWDMISKLENLDKSSVMNYRHLGGFYQNEIAMDIADIEDQHRKIYLAQVELKKKFDAQMTILNELSCHAEYCKTL